MELPNFLMNPWRVWTTNRALTRFGHFPARGEACPEKGREPRGGFCPRRRQWSGRVPLRLRRKRRKWRGTRGRAFCEKSRNSSRRVRSVVASSFVATTITGFSASFSLNAASSPSMISKSCTGSRSEASLVSIKCAMRRVRSMCFRNRMPRPAPVCAPSIKPGKSATTNVRPRSFPCPPGAPSAETTPRPGCSVVNG